MKQYFVELAFETYLKAIIYADSDEDAYTIAHEANISDMSITTSSRNTVEITRLTEEEAKEFDIVRLRQTATGYEIL